MPPCPQQSLPIYPNNIHSKVLDQTLQGIDPSDLKKAHVEGALRPRPERVMILMSEETLAMNQPWERSRSQKGWNEWPGDGTRKIWKNLY